MGRGQREQDHFEPIFGTRRGAGAEEDEPSLPEETEQELAGHFDEIGAARKEFEDLTHRAEAPILLGQRIAQGIIDQGIPEREFEVPAANGETHHYVIKNVHWTKGHLGRRQHCSGPVIIRNHRGERGKQQPSSLLWDPYDPGRRWDLQDPPEVKYAA